MTMKLDNKSYIVGLWFSSDPKNNNDWLGCVVRDSKNHSKYIGFSRFVYKKYNNIFNTDDEKSWTDFTSQENQSEQDMIDLMERLQLIISPGYPVKDSFIVKGTFESLVKLSGSKDWIKMEVVEE